MSAPSQPYILRGREGIKWDNIFKVLGTAPQHTAVAQWELAVIISLAELGGLF